MSKRYLIFIAVIILIVMSGTVLLTAQQSRVPEPRDIPGTVKNIRPTQWNKGNYGGNFVDSTVGDPKTFNESQSNDNTSTTMITYTAPYLFSDNLDEGTWEVYFGDENKGKTGKGYDLNIFDDGTLEIVIYLRKDIYWTDGTRMTADDWVFYHNEINCNDDIGSQSNPGTYIEMEDGSEEQKKAEKIDRWTFKIIYPRTPGEPEFFTNYNIMPKHILEPILQTQGADGIIEMWGMDTSVSELIGYGPWIIDSYSLGENIIFKRNERYFLKDEWNNRLPYIDSIVWSVVADSNAAMLKFKNNEIDLLNPIPYADFKNLVDESQAGGYDVWNGGPATGIVFVTFNQNPNSERVKGSPKLQWFEQKDFRKAMCYLIDRETIVSQALNGLGEPDKALLHPFSPYFDNNVLHPTEYNPNKALKLLEGIGMRDRNGDGIMEDKEGNKVEFELMSNEGNPEREKTTNIIAKDWGAYGIKANVAILEFNTVVDKLSNSFEWEAVVIGLTGGIRPSGSNVWVSNGGLHMWHPLQAEPATEWEAEVDRLWNEASYEPDYETRKALYMEMYSVLYDELPLILLYRKYEFSAVFKKWGNVYWDVFQSMGDDYHVKLFTKD